MTASAEAGTAWIVDASVAVKWFLPIEREPDGERARALIGQLPMRTTSLGFYEVGNVLTIHSGWPGEKVAAALDLLLEICGDPFAMSADDHRVAADLALAHDLSFYDASYVAIARRLGRGLLSADGDLLEPALATGLDASEALA